MGRIRRVLVDRYHSWQEAMAILNRTSVKDLRLDEEEAVCGCHKRLHTDTRRLMDSSTRMTGPILTRRRKSKTRRLTRLRMRQGVERRSNMHLRLLSQHRPSIHRCCRLRSNANKPFVTKFIACCKGSPSGSVTGILNRSMNERFLCLAQPFILENQQLQRWW